MRFPIVNRFTCSQRQLTFFITNIRKKQMLPIIDNVNENGKNHTNNLRNIRQDIETYPMNTFAIKLSSLNIRDANNDNNKLIDDVLELGELVREHDSKLIIDAEEEAINDKINEVSDMLMELFNKDYVTVYKTYQMYRRDTTSMLLNDLKKERDYYLGVKLVRGAYYNLDLHTNKLFWKIEDTHRCYNEGIQYFLNNCKTGDKMLCATHNHESNDIAKNLIHQGNKNISIGHLLGMSDYLSEELVDEGITIYKYLPYGEYKDTLPYLSRRLYENYPILGHMV